MLKKVGKIGAALAGLGALAVGGSAAAGAASQDGSTGQSAQPPAAYGQPPAGQPGSGDRPAHKPETPLTGTTADKVKEAALAKVAGGSVIRVETDTDHGSPYEAHVRKTDGTEVEVLVNKKFEVTAVNSFGPRG
jgi:uncharacterized membrane protein YkoI